MLVSVVLAWATTTPLSAIGPGSSGVVGRWFGSFLRREFPGVSGDQPPQSHDGSGDNRERESMQKE